MITSDRPERPLYAVFAYSFESLCSWAEIHLAGDLTYISRNTREIRTGTAIYRYFRDVESTRGYSFDGVVILPRSRLRAADLVNLRMTA